MSSYNEEKGSFSEDKNVNRRAKISKNKDFVNQSVVNVVKTYINYVMNY